MIRDFRNADVEPVLDIWLQASLLAHHFIAPAFWHGQLSAMREIYLPSAVTRVFEVDGQVRGFSCVYENTLAALFVSPAHQSRGVGTQLLEDAMGSRAALQLSVYSQNVSSIHFYQKNGFIVLSEQRDEHTGHLEKVMHWVSDRSTNPRP
ncbi:GNAT family N-acetyltransferase [Pseudomonas carnis]|uniref:GNAT family N-acetyltransferase n=1 Tax=Pseudomonas carnis TaxID=2487355 RepID=UPI0018DA323F|nr:GNAT family N-acetyltransferase [Pseudomonas carnis]MBH3465707.1 GNAT family N-acetyltransferase [Pseudomonas carnis]